ncbi:WD40 repeat-like protein [Microstroma glucosiphilum]|uniref:WD40 repeat-like protein n=1 Tax=Pseudomicrostroma glucosiphilum TaxID=1684307 RepID=A0A316UGD7_9BASI|nr:WD40 repeat-like protein [Pseudomicrostroma glucosiphilum]PWN24270.1 WD40 repeat-like protein [Pseudomicrostroma glucosiphilum]
MGGPSNSAAGPSSSSTANTKKPPTVPLSAELISSFRPSKIFKTAEYIQPSHSFTSLDFDDRGEMCVSSASDERIQLWNIRSGRHAKVLNSKKYGVNLARFTHSSSTVLYASTKTDDTIRYHSLHDNRYLQYFRGHKSRVCAIQMNPVNDTFLSAAVGDTIRLWDLRKADAIAQMPVQGHPTVAYDPSGEVFALGLSERMAVLLYARKEFTTAPFLVLEIEDDAYLSRISMPPRPANITSLVFSPAAESGHLLVGTAGDQHYILDTWSNAYKWRLVGHQGLEGVSVSSGAQSGEGSAGGESPSEATSGEELCWSPDGNFVLAGTANGEICVWKIPSKEQAPEPGAEISLEPIARLKGHSGPVRTLAFSPRSAVLASGGSAASFWLPPAPSKDE